jgi:hypothetical protein
MARKHLFTKKDRVSFNTDGNTQQLGIVDSYNPKNGMVTIRTPLGPTLAHAQNVKKVDISKVLDGVKGRVL